MKGNVKAIYSQGASIEGRFAAPVAWPPGGGSDAASGSQRLPKPEPRTAKELFSCLNIAVLPEIKIHCLALFIDRTIEIHPVPLDLDIGFTTWKVSRKPLNVRKKFAEEPFRVFFVTS